tara:strand:+ start:151 stop:1308 length:1158 start_codon:yes stop_codon:yes gene_type:complete
MLILLTSVLLSFMYKTYLSYAPVTQENLYFFNFIKSIDFSDLLITYMLSYMLFAGSLLCDIKSLKKHSISIASLAFIGTTISTFTVGTLTFYLLSFFGFSIQYIHCLIFGAVVSPTDPIAVLDMLKHLNAPKGLRNIIAGESLFNDGVAIILFMTLIKLSESPSSITISSTVLLFLQQSVGGLVFGYIMGYIANWLNNLSDKNNEIEVIITIWITTTGYWLANSFGFSGPLAMVVSGMYIGNSIKASQKDKLINFWKSIDHLLNAVLFFLIGFEFILFDMSILKIIIPISITIICLTMRALSVGVSLLPISRKQNISPSDQLVIIWGGIKGGLTLALSLIMPNIPNSNIFIISAYFIVIFSILIQGFSIKYLLNKLDYLHSQKVV